MPPARTRTRTQEQIDHQEEQYEESVPFVDDVENETPTRPRRQTSGTQKSEPDEFNEDKGSAKYAQGFTFYRTDKDGVPTYAMQFSLSPQRVVDGKTKSGCIFISAAKGLGNKKEDGYDWKNKFSIALSDTDLGKFGYMLETLYNSSETAKNYKGEDERIYHPYKGSNKNLTLRATDKYMSIELFVDASHKANITLSYGDLYALIQLVNFSIPRVLGWDKI